MESFLSNLNPKKIKLFAYSTQPNEDDLTKRLKNNFSAWNSIYGKNDQEASQSIHDDQIHILFDLSGHTSKNRLPVFSYKPAPIQVTWLGYWATTGVAEIDYFLGDPFRTPYDEDNHFTESIWQLPETSLCFSKPRDNVEIKSLPALSNGFITFGCFNNLTKLTDEVVKVRADILKSVPESKLFLKNRQLSSDQILNSVLDKFAQHNISSDRLILEGSSPRKEYFEAYNKVDISLSPFPFSGHTTSLEGLWMGVPVLVRKGNNCVSHHGELITHHAGLTEWIASDNNEYIKKAIELSADLNKLSNLRNDLREKTLSSPLFDSERFAKYFEEALFKMWNKYEKDIKAN